MHTKHTGLNGGYYSGGLQQAHSTTPHEAPHSAGAPTSVPPPSAGPPPTVSAISAVQPQGIPHGLVSKSVSVISNAHHPYHLKCIWFLY